MTHKPCYYSIVLFFSIIANNALVAERPFPYLGRQSFPTSDLLFALHFQTAIPSLQAHYDDVTMSNSSVGLTVCFGWHQGKFKCLFWLTSQKSPKLQFTGLCEGNPLVSCGFPWQRVSNTENVPFDDVIMPHIRHTNGVCHPNASFANSDYVINIYLGCG